MIYVAAPYSSRDKDIVQKRMEHVYSIMATYMKNGVHIITPLFMHEVVTRHTDIPTDFEYWDKYCFDVLKRCDKMLVLKLEGWDTSRGVQEEIKFCKENNIPIEYI